MIFEINYDSKVQVEYIDDFPIYSIENFYKYPDRVVNFFSKYQTTLWKYWERPSFNGIHFDDRRQRIETDEISTVYNYLSTICGQTPQKNDHVITNITKFINRAFNDYENNYWWPHKDSGYNGVIYFTEIENAGTNLYENINDQITSTEHDYPWRDKNKWKLLKKISSKFNKLVLFDGAKFSHGMNIEDDYYFKQYRINQVFFFQ